MSTPSRFLYDRSLQRDVAAVLADARSRCWCEPQLIMLDRIIDDLVEQFADDRSFDADDFARRCGAQLDRLPIYHPPTKEAHRG